jgi:hypothetical protein
MRLCTQIAGRHNEKRCRQLPATRSPNQAREMLKNDMDRFNRLQTMNAAIEQPAVDPNLQRSGEGPLEQELEFLWQDRDFSGERYDLYLGRISRNPVVRSHSTGKYFMLPWSEIVELADEHGINER